MEDFADGVGDVPETFCPLIGESVALPPAPPCRLTEQSDSGSEITKEHGKMF